MFFLPNVWTLWWTLSKKKKKKHQITALAKIDEYVAQFEREFSPYVGCTDRAYITSVDVEDQREYSLLVGHSLSASTTPSNWYIDSGDLSHMTGA